MYAEIIADDLKELAWQYGYDIEIKQRGNSYDVFLIYPKYCINEPHRLMTFSDEFSESQMLRDSGVERKVLEVIKRNSNKRIVKV